jgi:hydroxymethylglutaryl-CoA synthase
MTVGILAAGAYIPRLRLSRRVIAETNRWISPSLMGQAKGERAICNWDEDTVTMAVEAARDALSGRDRSDVNALHLASTTLPFMDRLNAGIAAEALNLTDDIDAADLTGSQRAATSALRNAFSRPGQTLIVAAEKRRAKAGSAIEMSSGDAGVAMVVGAGEPIARLVASATRTADFVDHYRTEESVYDYQWEERWVRDTGYLEIVPPVIARCVENAALQAGDIEHFCIPSALPRVAHAVAKAAGISETAIADSLHAGCGDSGAAHPLLMLLAVLERAEPGQRILVVGFGQGADAMLFEVTTAMPDIAGRLGVSGCLARRREETNYAKFLTFNDNMQLERGMRAETDKLTPLSALWRNREAVTSFIGGRCQTCGTLQFPKSRICVNPNCNDVDTQEPHPFADKIGHVNSYTADRLTYSPDPPACYGMIQFDEGGRWMMDFTDVEAECLEVGMPMRMTFRVKDIDVQRGFRRYFWKAAPTSASETA